MASNDQTVFSEFEAREMNFIFGEGDVYNVKCIGKVEEEATVRTIIKKCRGTVAKKRTRGTGEGTLKLTAHIPYELYLRLLDMNQDDLVAGVHSYGQNNLHPDVCITARIFDEDDNEKLAAWPKCTISTGANRTIENGGDEVAEVEVEVGYSPDSYGQGSYEALVANVEAENVKTQWLNAFTPELVRETTPSV